MLCWKFGVETQGVITKDEFVGGLESINATNAEELQAAIERELVSLANYCITYRAGREDDDLSTTSTYSCESTGTFGSSAAGSVCAGCRRASQTYDDGSALGDGGAGGGSESDSGDYGDDDDDDLFVNDDYVRDPSATAGGGGSECECGGGSGNSRSGNNQSENNQSENNEAEPSPAISLTSRTLSEGSCAGPAPFESLFRYAFRFTLEPGAKVLDVPTASILLRLLVNHLPLSSPHLEPFLTFVSCSEASGCRALNADQWTSFLEFSATVASDGTGYDSDAFPLVYDDYVEWLAAGRPLPTPVESAASESGGSDSA